jgi:hypothetical protein
MGGLDVSVVYASMPFSTVPRRKRDAGIELSFGQEDKLLSVHCSQHFSTVKRGPTFLPTASVMAFRDSNRRGEHDKQILSMLSGLKEPTFL